MIKKILQLVEKAPEDVYKAISVSNNMCILLGGVSALFLDAIMHRSSGSGTLVDVLLCFCAAFGVSYLLTIGTLAIVMRTIEEDKHV